MNHRPGLLVVSSTLFFLVGGGNSVPGAERPEPPLPPSIHAAFAPTLDIKPGDEITFKVRTFRTPEGGETWDFGDGSPVEHADKNGTVVARLHVRVGEE
jgi:hypothetical protein